MTNFAFGFVSFIYTLYSVLTVVEEKGEIFRKSVCCVPCSDSEGDEVATDAESNNCKTAKQGKIEENTVIESTERKKNESRKKVSLLILRYLF